MDKLLKNYAYSFDEFGVFTGMVRKIEVFEGEMVAPKNSCTVKPVLVEGYSPVWNGISWDQLSKDSPILAARRLLPGLSAALDEKKASMLEFVIKDAKKVVYDELEKCLEVKHNEIVREQKVLLKESLDAQNKLNESLASFYSDRAKLQNEIKTLESSVAYFNSLSFWQKILIIFGLKKLNF